MKFKFNQSEPIYRQIAKQLKEMIFLNLLNEGEQVPSTTQLSQELKINPATVLKGMNILVDDGLLEKHRGMGLFVKKGAREKIIAKRQEEFCSEYIDNLISESKNLGLTKQQLIDLIERRY
ncbi:GntR family transcriptional regulator [Ligilactobacillus cholophilus]|uniref:GntR family transcriptional regulator n=1 Tax=Ligilactobacillus cholophilus TaxID=3050131 RepID=UPI0025B22331|nr:GntR family transcriptional regulator [Ligilactobacillus cholophilus]